jgi:hypothetical protein
MATFGNPKTCPPSGWRWSSGTDKFFPLRKTKIEIPMTYRTMCAIVQVVMFFIVIKWVAGIAI